MSRKKYYRKTIPLYVLVGFDLINDVLRGSEKKVKTIEKVWNWFEIEIEENSGGGGRSKQLKTCVILSLLFLF